MFVTEDERHAEQHGQFATFEEAFTELKRRAEIPWDKEPNYAPCTNWQKCGRSYEVIEYDDSQTPWKRLSAVAVLKVSATGVQWSSGFEEMNASS
jgi:hypothetical protein